MPRQPQSAPAIAPDAAAELVDQSLEQSPPESHLPDDLPAWLVPARMYHWAEEGQFPEIAARCCGYPEERTMDLYRAGLAELERDPETEHPVAVFARNYLSKVAVVFAKIWKAQYGADVKNNLNNAGARFILERGDPALFVRLPAAVAAEVKRAKKDPSAGPGGDITIAWETPDYEREAPE